MNKTQANKKAWEEVYEHKSYKTRDIVRALQKEEAPFLDEDLKKALNRLPLAGKTVYHPFSNNGRELLSLCNRYGAKGVGFDFAENMVQDANAVARKTNIDAIFIATDVLSIPESYDGKADYLLITVGSLSWIKDLPSLFSRFSKLLKPKGILVIQDSHPVADMFAADDEDNYNSDFPNLSVNDYFSRKEWVSNDGMPYMSTLKKSSTFYDHSFTIGDLINAMAAAGIAILSFEESPEDKAGILGKTPPKGIPLSFLMQAYKP